MRPLRLLLLSLVMFAAAVCADAATVRGRVLVRGRYGMGIAVTVWNQQYGRSAPAYCGPDGMYYLYNIPPGLSYLEVWVNPGQPPIVYPLNVVAQYVDFPQLSF